MGEIVGIDGKPVQPTEADTKAGELEAVLGSADSNKCVEVLLASFRLYFLARLKLEHIVGDKMTPEEMAAFMSYTSTRAQGVPFTTNQLRKDLRGTIADWLRDYKQGVESASSYSTSEPTPEEETQNDKPAEHPII